MKTEVTIAKLIALKKRNGEIGALFLKELQPLHLSDVGKTLKPFSDIENQIDKAIKSITNERSIPKTSVFK